MGRAGIEPATLGLGSPCGHEGRMKSRLREPGVPDAYYVRLPPGWRREEIRAPSPEVLPRSFSRISARVGT
jgi:hypothetical protein